MARFVVFPAERNRRTNAAIRQTAGEMDTVREHVKQNIIMILLVTVMIFGDIAAVAGNAFTQQSISSSLGPVPYPAKGQPVDRQNQDEAEKGATIQHFKRLSAPAWREEAM